MAVSKDALKTIAGLVVIALIIVGAFLYGNAQHQSQVRQNQNTKSQAGTNAGNVGGQTGAKSGQSQAPAKSAATPAPAAQAPASQPGQGGVSQTPQTGAADELLPLAALAVVLVAYRSSLPKRAAR